jgi:hypothetical protein
MWPNAGGTHGAAHYGGSIPPEVYLVPPPADPMLGAEPRRGFTLHIPNIRPCALDHPCDARKLHY